MSSREALEGLQVQGLSAERRYAITVPTSWGTPTGTPTVTAYNERDWSDVTDDVVTGVASISGQVITTAKIKSARRDATYRIRVIFDVADGVEDCYFRVRGEL